MELWLNLLVENALGVLGFATLTGAAGILASIMFILQAESKHVDHNSQ
jgi:hypothetical protein